MIKLSRTAWIVAAVAAAAVPTSIAVAKHGGGWGWHKMSPEARARLEDGRIAMAKTALKLTAEQEPLWAAVEKEIRTGFEMRAKRREEFRAKREERRKARREAKDGDRKAHRGRDRDLAKRFERMSERVSSRAERLKAFSAAFSPFYASLSNEQKEVIRPLMRKLSPRGGRRHGHRGWRHGGRWADGGRGHHRGGKHHRRGHDDKKMERGADADETSNDDAEEGADE